MKAVFDTNILIDFLNGHAAASSTLATYTDKIISRITWMEVLVGAKDSSDEAIIRSFLGTFRVAELSASVAEKAVQLRRNDAPKLKLPDAIIYATAREEACNLVTRNTKDFSSSATDVAAPYVV